MLLETAHFDARGQAVGQAEQTVTALGQGADIAHQDLDPAHAPAPDQSADSDAQGLLIEQPGIEARAENAQLAGGQMRLGEHHLVGGARVADAQQRLVPARVIEIAPHGEVRDTGLVEGLAARAKTRARVEIHGLGLRVQVHREVAARLCQFDKAAQQLPAEALAAPILKHRQAADTPVLKQAAAADGLLLVLGDDVQGLRVATVPFDRLRHALLVDKHAAPDLFQGRLVGGPLGLANRWG